MNSAQEALVEVLYAKVSSRLNSYAQKSLRDFFLAEEAVQDTFRIACMKIGEVVDSPNPEGWLMNTLKNVISNMRHAKNRLSRRIINIPEGSRDYLAHTVDEVSLDILYGGLVSAEEFNLLRRIVLEGYTVREMAREMRISAEACKKRLQRTKSRFSKGLRTNA